MTAPPFAILLMGPTASGKSAIVIELARRFPVGIVSVDSAQVFCGMDIGTAKPDKKTLQAFPHDLIDLITPEESYSAARFREDALSAMSRMTRRGQIPLLAGGTMLYFKALLSGLHDLPKADAAIRAEIDALAAKAGWPFVHAELAKVDPLTAARVSPSDTQRIQRALEVYRVSGHPLSLLIQENQRQKPPYAFLSLGMAPSDRSQLHERIAKRFDAMLDAGLSDELYRLRKRYRLNLELPSMRCVGYRQVWEAQDGLVPWAETRDRGVFATRQLAKRQITWMKNTLNPEIFDCLDPRVAEKITSRIAEAVKI